MINQHKVFSTILREGRICSSPAEVLCACQTWSRQPYEIYLFAEILPLSRLHKIQQQIQIQSPSPGSNPAIPCADFFQTVARLKQSSFLRGLCGAVTHRDVAREKQESSGRKGDVNNFIHFQDCYADRGKGGAASVSVPEHRKITMVKAASNLQRK